MLLEGKNIETKTIGQIFKAISYDEARIKLCKKLELEEKVYTGYILRDRESTVLYLYGHIRKE